MLRRTRRVLATVLFTDIVRSTEVAAELGDRRWRTVLAAHHRLVRAALRRHHGREIDNAGDGFFAIFQQPTEAVRCAASIAASVHVLGIDVRAAIHVGECEVIGPKVAGIAVVIASRVLSESGPGEVVVTSTVHDLVAGSQLEFHEIGLRSLKGVSGQWRLFRLQSTAALEESALADSQAAARSRRLGVRQVGLLLAAAVALTAGAATLVLLVVVAPGATIPPGPNTLVSLDDEGEPTDVVRVPDGPEHIAYDGVQLWIGSEDAGVVTRFSPVDAGGLMAVGQLGRPTSMVAADGEVWVADRFARELRRVEPNGQQRFVVPDRSVQTLALGFGSLWATDDVGERVLRVDRETGAIEAPIDLPPGSDPDGVIAGTDSLWVAATGLNNVLEIDPITNELTRSIALRSPPTELAFAGDWLWALAPTTDELYQIDPSTARVADARTVCDEPSSVVADEAGAWVACRQGQSIWRVLADGTEGEHFAVNGVPTALVFVEGRLWTVLRAD